MAGKEGIEKDMKTVSVIVLSYRSAATIEQTLDSIKEQDYKDIELIITDDCSPDNTVEICKSWISRNGKFFSKVQLVTSDRNTGIPGNINRALRHITGDYIKLIAADDLLLEHAISSYVQFVQEHPKCFPIAKVKLFCDEDSNATFPDVQKYCERCYEYAKCSYQEQYQKLLMSNWIVAPSASFYTTEVIQRVGGYDENFRWFEDYPMNLKLMHEGYSFGIIEQELIAYRMSSASITGSQNMRLKKTEMRLFFQKKFWYMVQAGMGWEAIKQCKYWMKIWMSK